ncbi:hypothetical protein K3495_g3514 [Podosphaera aphanis]|nr:hypothetical protein K3495_g3514 [Podosphaera aphanis]
MGDLCFRCGDLGHRGPNCRGKPLEIWEQNYLREVSFQGLRSNFAGFGGSTGGFRYRDIQNSSWRGRISNSEENLGQRMTAAGSAPEGQEQITPETRTDEDGFLHLTCKEYDGVPCQNVRTDSARCKSVIIGLENKDTPSSRSVSVKLEGGELTLELYLSAANSKKRVAPMEIENLLNNDEHTAKILKKATKEEDEDDRAIGKSMRVTLEEEDRQYLEAVLLADLAERDSENDKRLNEKFLASDWYRDVAEYLGNRRFSAESKTKVQQAALIRKVTNLFVSTNGDLYY